MDQTYDVVILGTGPAGLQASIHAGRKNASVLVLGRWTSSSLFRAHVENYCCLGKLSGEELLSGGRHQAEKAGAVFLDQDVVEIRSDLGGVTIRTESGQEVFARTLIIATGIARNHLGVAGEKDLLGRGVSYCVDCDANFYRGEKVAVIGGASAGVSGSLQMLAYASEVHLIFDELSVTEELAVKLKDSPVILHPQTKVESIEGETGVTGLKMESDRGTEELDVAGVFIELGAKGAVELAGVIGVDLDPESMKYIQVNRRQETNLPGVYAAGDITGPPWQMAKAVGEGCVAGLEAARYAKKTTKGF